MTSLVQLAPYPYWQLDVVIDEGYEIGYLICNFEYELTFLCVRTAF